ncbi:hypothetical protein [Inhella gelatinilytica]|uniref:VCBS repeat-containing protein n=1 Tax=Inhella gelatinilytica TaxID=2795030 RepID=A0A931IU37_9BURK|nr:hypothetical protein [Inhella gelatinilytica]MBH9551982.1 hypothetical protein [Inhella gelatinilytica]
MKIGSSSVELASSHASFQRLERREHERAWLATRRPDFDGRPTRVQVSEAGRRAAQEPAPARAAEAADPAKASAEAVRHDPKLQLLRTMLWLMFGERLPDPVADLEDPQAAVDAQELRGPEDAEVPPEAAPAPTQPPPEDWGVERTVEETRVAFESTHFSAQGVVRTADGRELRFELELELSQLHIEHSRETLRAGPVKDPLVLTFDGPAANLLGPRWDFDLDADGIKESLPGLGAGSGWLVFDRNHDGQANDGTELFGPHSGDAFADLAQLDADGNGWIDEADPAWADLKVWRPGGGLQSLSEVGVGALNLARLATPFGLSGADGSAQGQLSRSGFYLREDGRPGLLQQVDVRV